MPKYQGKYIATRPKFILATFPMVVALLVSSDLVAAQGADFVADLSGSQVVPPRETDATGQATFRLSPDANALTFELSVTDLEDVIASHIHCASIGENGPVGVSVSGGAPGLVNGLLAQGIITAPDTRNGCGWASFASIVDGIRSGNTYVNVHASANPLGEIRGQIQ